MPAHTRNAKHKDVPRLLEIYKAGSDQRAHEYPRLSTFELTNYLHWPHIRLPVVESAGQVAGFALVFDHVLWAYLDVLVVAPEFRGRGLGSALLACVQKLEPRWLSIETGVRSDDGELQAWLMRGGFVGKDLLEWKILWQKDRGPR